MATPQERAQEIANRGIQGSLSPERKESFDELVRRKVINLPGGQTFDIESEEGQRELQTFLGRDPEFDQSGLQDASLRAGLSRMDTPEEKEAFLTSKVGVGGFTRDRSGNLALTVEGQKVLGLENTKPLIIDEPGLTAQDIADLRGIAPSVIGGVSAGFATTGLGIPVAAGLTGLSAATFKGIDEALDEARGENLQTAAEVGKDILTEGALAATGEVVFRGLLAPLGRKMLAPNRPVLKPGAEELAEEAIESGIKPKIGNLVHRPVVARISGMVDTIFGDPNAAKNAKVLNNQIDSLRTSFGRRIDEVLDLGTRIKEGVKGARKEFGRAANAKFALVDEFTRDEKIIFTSQIKSQAADLLEAIPKSAKGKPILVAPERVKELQDILSLPDSITVEQLQALRTTLFDKIEDTLTPGMKSREASLLVRSANKTVDDAISQMEASAAPSDVLATQGLKALKDARKFYKEGIRQFDNATLKRIAKDPSVAGSLDPEKVIDLLFKKGSVTPMKRVLEVVPEETANELRSAAMQRILNTASKESGDPLVDAVFDGTGFIKTLNSFGKPTLKAAFGEQKTEELFRLGRVIQSASKPKGASGGIVAASIAVRPLQNIGRLLKLRMVAQLMNSETGIRWLTMGIKAPKTRAGSAALARLATQVELLKEE